MLNVQDSLSDDLQEPQPDFLGICSGASDDIETSSLAAQLGSCPLCTARQELTSNRHASLGGLCHAMNMLALCRQVQPLTVTSSRQSNARRETGKVVLHNGGFTGNASTFRDNASREWGA